MPGVLVSHAMTRDPLVATEDTSLSEVVSQMRKHRISGLPVVNASGRVVGVLSQKDVVRALRLVSADKSTVPPPGWPLDGDWNPAPDQEEFLRRGKAGRAMSPDPVIIAPNATLDVAAGIMEERHISRLPVVDGRHLVGILTRHDIFTAVGGSKHATAKTSR
ncbi:MAG TPA: CBS domain-containing protein [Thermoplasmata archaeon]|nr:CBS domain-containing protein [Thermoplasmata archaeon]